jgi:hypothetical protein
MLATAAGCGDESGDAEPSGPTVALHVTRDFGRDQLAAEDTAPLEGHGTVLRLLRGYHDVRTAYEDTVVMAIDGRRYRATETSTRGWVSNVNGIETDAFPSDHRLTSGDVVQWDMRDWDSALDVRATVGAFPETFTQGTFGSRFPTTVWCAPRSQEPCRQVKRRLRAAGAGADGRRPESRPPKGEVQRAKVLVGAWNELRGPMLRRVMAAGPRDSGVFARFVAGGERLRLMDWNAESIREEGAGTGLVAAVRPTEPDLYWLITGVDAVGVRRAAEALDGDVLRDAFAVAVTANGVVKLPLPPEGS